MLPNEMLDSRWVDERTGLPVAILKTDEKQIAALSPIYTGQIGVPPLHPFHGQWTGAIMDLFDRDAFGSYRGSPKSIRLFGAGYEAENGTIWWFRSPWSADKDVIHRWIGTTLKIMEERGYDVYCQTKEGK